MAIAANGDVLDEIEAPLDAALGGWAGGAEKRPKTTRYKGVPMLRAKGTQLLSSGVTFFTGFSVRK